MEAPGKLERDHPGGVEGTAEQVPFLPALPGYLRPLRGLRRQMPFLHRLRRPQEHARPAGGTPAVGLPEVFHGLREDFWESWPAPGSSPTDVLKEWFYYFYQCTECRRCSVFCPYGIDQAEITMMGRELLNLVGCNINWVIEPAANCFRTGNHLGIQPHGDQRLAGIFRRGYRGSNGSQSRAPHQQERGGDPLCHPFGGLLRGPRDVHLHGLSHALPRDRSRLHLDAPMPRRGEISASSLPTR